MDTTCSELTTDGPVCSCEAWHTMLEGKDGIARRKGVHGQIPRSGLELEHSASVGLNIRYFFFSFFSHDDEAIAPILYVTIIPPSSLSLSP